MLPPRVCTLVHARRNSVACRPPRKLRRLRTFLAEEMYVDIRMLVRSCKRSVCVIPCVSGERA